MDKHVLRRWRNGFGAHIYGQAIVVLIQLVGVPVLLHYWGSQLYGEWLILSAIPTYLAMTDLGFSQSAANDMTQRVARGDVDGALAVFQSLGAMVFSVAFIGLLVVLALLIALPIGRWMHFQVLSSTDVRWVLALLAAEVLVRLTEGVSHAGFRAHGDYALRVGIYYSTLFCQSAFVWIVAAAGFGPVAAATSCRRARTGNAGGSPHHGATPPGARIRARAREARAPSRLDQTGDRERRHPFAEALNLQGMVLAIGGTLGPLAVVVFSTLRTMARLAVQAVQTVSQAAEPELAAAYGSGERLLLAELFVHALRAGIWLSCAAAVVLLVAGGSILSFWTRGKVAMDVALFRWLLVSAVFGALWFSSLTVLKAANRHVRAASLYAVVTAMSVVLATSLLHVTGRLASAGMALVLVDLVMIGYALPAAARLCGSRSVGVVVAALDPVPLVRLVRKAAHDT